MTFTAAASGYFMSQITQRNALEATAGDTALFVSGITGPVARELELQGEISSASRSRLDTLLTDQEFAARFPFLEIWLPDGTIAYSNVPSLTGKSFPLPDAAKRAMKGEVVSALSDLEASEHRFRNWVEPYLEVYTPLRAPDTGVVIAIAEIHEVSGPLEERLARLRLQTWLVVAAVGLFIMGGLFGVVAKAARQIDRQQARLAHKVVQLQQALDINQTLRERVRSASERVSEINERFLRHLGAELHDGPVQLLGFATLNVERLRCTIKSQKAEELLNSQEQVLQEAQAEIRQIAKGLLLPDILELDLRSIIERAIKIHEARTNRTVDLIFPNTSLGLSDAVKICAFRFVQEGLINTFKHSDGRAAITVGNSDDDRFLITVCNNLPEEASFTTIEEGLGLTGMRERIESLGGTMLVNISDVQMQLVMELPRART